MNLIVIPFEAADGDRWWSVVDLYSGEIATGVMHQEEENAKTEIAQLMSSTELREQS